MPFLSPRSSLLVTLVACAALAASAFAQDQVPIDRNVKLRIQLDRTTIRAFEPVYLVLTAEQFVSGDVEVQYSKDKGPFRPIALESKSWQKTDIRGKGALPSHRMGIVLQAHTVNGQRSFVFAEPGVYRLVVKLGVGDGTNLDLTVTPAENGEAQAWASLTDSNIDFIINDNFGDEPVQATIDACANVMRKYPRTVCAGYCQSYISITRFKVLYDKNKKQGGKAVYGAVADELDKVAQAFRDGFFGEMTGFYSAYAKGLAKDYPGLLGTISQVRTRMTVWGDALDDMQAEVFAHIGPKVVEPDLNNLSPASQPAANGKQ